MISFNRSISFQSKSNSCEEIDIKEEKTHQTTMTPPARPKPTFKSGGFAAIREQPTNGQQCHSAPTTPATVVKKSQPKIGSNKAAPPPVKVDITQQGSPGIKKPPPKRPPPRRPIVVNLTEDKQSKLHMYNSVVEMQEAEMALKAQLLSKPNKTDSIRDIEPYAVFKPKNLNDDGEYVDMDELYMEMNGGGPVGNGSGNSAPLQQDGVYIEIPASPGPNHIYEAVQHDHHGNRLSMCPPTVDAHIVPTHYELPHTNFNKPSSIYSSLSSHTTGISIIKMTI